MKIAEIGIWVLLFGWWQH